MAQATNTRENHGEAPSQKLERLRTIISNYKSMLVCFSGGIDSALLLAVAHEQLGKDAVAMTAVSPSLPEREKKSAATVALAIGARHCFVPSDEISRPLYVKNAPDRCFHCKTELYTIAEAKRKEWGLRVVANGTNQDDQGDYRPGLEAARNAKVCAPLAEAGLDKADVRACAQILGLKIWDKPASACLSSRIPYGVSVTRERLAQVEGFEDDLRDLGFLQVRVRWHKEIARIEVPLTDLARLIEEDTNLKVITCGRRHGFQFITADLSGYRTGSLNELLSGRSLKVITDN